MKRLLAYAAAAGIIACVAVMLRHGGGITPASHRPAAAAAPKAPAGAQDAPGDDGDTSDSFPPPLLRIAQDAEPERDNLRPVTVTVLGNEMPLAEATVTLEHGGRRGGRIVETTDSNGIVRAEVPRKADELVISASKGRFASVSFTTSGIARADAAIEVALRLSEPGVIITAEIQSEHTLDPRNLVARIVSRGEGNDQWLRAAFATTAVADRIEFPAIRIGLSNLAVMVRCGNGVACYSEPFDTCDGLDKTVVVEVPDTLTMTGRAVLDTGGPARSFSLIARPVSLRDAAFKTGMFKGTVETDRDGAYEVSPLVPAVYVLKADCTGCYELVTNVWFVDSSVPVDLTFVTIKYATLTGRVEFAENGQPAPDVTVTMTTWLGPGSRAQAESDDDGSFTFALPLNPDGPMATVKAEKSGYAPAMAFIGQDFDGELVVLRLRQVGAIAGVVRNEQLDRLAGIEVVARPAVPAAQKGGSPPPSNERAFFMPDERKPTVSYSFMRYSSAPTDDRGNYIISNVAAPEVYAMDVSSERYFVTRPPGASLPRASVEPGSTAWCDLPVREMSIFMVRASDEEGTPIAEYSLRIELVGGGTRGKFEDRVKRGGEWQPVHLKGRPLFADTLVSLQALSGELVSGMASNMPLCGPATNFVQLVLLPQEPLISGSVLMPDDSPAPRAVIEATATKTFCHARVVSDDAGWFAVYGLETETPTERIALRVRAKWGEYADAVTNVAAHSQNIVIRLDPMLTLRGTVHYEVVGNPATNFTIRIGTGKMRRSFWPEDGTFTWFIPGSLKVMKGSLFTTAPGFVPVETPFAFGATSNVCDVGDIVLGAQNCVLKGSVVNQARQPLSAEVVVRKEGTEGVPWQLITRSSAMDGSFIFSGLPVCQVKLFARTVVGSAESPVVTLLANDTVYAPELVIATTNAQQVTFMVTKADGTAGANLYIEKFHEFTDASGMMTVWVLPRTYSQVIAYSAWWIGPTGGITPNRTGALVYYADPFEVVPGVRSVRIVLRAGDHLAGVATINGRPVNDTLLFEHVAKQARLDVVVSSGLFALDGPEGPYVVTYRNRHAAVATVLTKDAQNVVALQTGSSVLTVQYPWRGAWLLDVRLQLGAWWATVASIQRDEVLVVPVTDLVAGHYRLAVRGRTAAGPTNFTAAVILNGTERRVVMIGRD